jgi:uncharacterized membrane protein
MTLENIVLVTGGTLTGLIAGLFYAFQVAFIPALRHIKGTQHIAAMQAINHKIENPVFFLSFFGPTILLPLAAYLQRRTTEFPLLAAAAALHILGSNGVTIARHIPMNREFDTIDASQLSEAEADQIRSAFQGPGTPWMRWHAVRTLAAAAATALVLIACLSRSASK